MKTSKYRKAMRPKKYLTRDFVVYQDPKYKLKTDVPYKDAIKEREIEKYLTRPAERPAKTLTDNFGEVDPEKGWQRFPDYLDAMDENEKNEKNNSTERSLSKGLGSDSETDNQK
jgi:hypothetical protein